MANTTRKRIPASQLPDWDLADHLHSDADIAEYLSQVLADGDPEELAEALGIVARARNMSQLARDTGLTREGLYKALSPQGNPSLATVVKVIHALGLRLAVVPAQA